MCLIIVKKYLQFRYICAIVIKSIFSILTDQ